jgi:MFS family permease
MISMSVYSVLSDKYGRLATFRIQILGYVIGYILFFLQWNKWMIMFGLISAMCSANIFINTQVYFYESVPQHVYSVVMSGINSLNGSVGFLYTVWVFKYKETDTLTSAVLFVTICIAFVAWFMFLESPEWLLKHYKKCGDIAYLDNVKTNYKFLMRFNKKRVADDGNTSVALTQSLIDETNNAGHIVAEAKDNVQKLSFSQMLLSNIKNKEFLIHYFTSLYLWITNQLIYYQTFINLNRFEYYIDHASLVFYPTFIAGSLIAMFISNLLNRKTVIIFTSFGAFCCVASIYFLGVTGIYSTILFGLFNIFIYTQSNIAYIFIPELFKNEVRSTAVSYSKLPAMLMMFFVSYFFTSIMRILFAFNVLVFLIPVMVMFCKETKKN